ncbi:MAG: hypothetical protein ACYDBQ_12160 [Thermoplasmatota archaeon]
MATGVASHFLELLESDQRAAGRRLAVSAVAVALLLVPAFALLPWTGLVIHLVAAALGVALGMGVAARETRRWESSLRTAWQKWMRFAVACESVSQIARRVAGRTARNPSYVLAAGISVLWVVEMALLWIALEGSSSAALAIPVLLLNGLLAGALVGLFFRVQRWTAALRTSVGELVESGELSLWGVV